MSLPMVLSGSSSSMGFVGLVFLWIILCVPGSVGGGCGFLWSFLVFSVVVLTGFLYCFVVFGTNPLFCHFFPQSRFSRFSSL